MILDKNLEFADAVDVSAAAGTALVGDVIDLDTIGRRLGASQNISFYVTVSTTFTSAGAAVVQFKLVSDSAAAIDTTGAATEHFVSNDFAYTALNQGVMIHGRLPAGIPNFRS
jgi:putative aminopeptidase FrvX